MKRIVFALTVLLPLIAHCQGEQAIWTVGDNNVLNFNSTPPSFGTAPAPSFEFASVVCWPNGIPRFYVDLKSTNGNKIFAWGGLPVPASNLLSDHGAMTSSNNVAKPVIVPKPGNPDQYFIFHSKDRALFYSLLDMSQNGGNGAVITKDFMISPYGTITPGRIVPVKACDGVWLVARRTSGNSYASFKINSSGVSTIPVISVAGLMTQTWGEYEYGYNAAIKASKDGTKIATYGAYSYGVELYDFEKCSGKLTNARLIDTTGNPPPSSQQERTRYSGLCFSEDGKLLYVAMGFPYKLDSIANGFSYCGNHGTIYQFNTSLPNLSAVVSSKTVVMENPATLTLDFLSCTRLLKPAFQDIKMGRDGKIYVFNGVAMMSCNPSLVPGTSAGPAFHIINQPNNLGSLCQPIYNVVATGNSTLNVDQLPAEIVITQTNPDTLPTRIIPVVACFKDSVLLSLPASASCPIWNDETSDKFKWTKSNGNYSVRYFLNGCQYRTDTFKVAFIKLPNLTDSNFSCINTSTGIATIVPRGDTTNFIYTWLDNNGNILRQKTSKNGDTVSVLPVGRNSLNIRTASGCDTTLEVKVVPLPSPITNFTVGQPTCTGVPVTFSANGVSQLHYWSIDGGPFQGTLNKIDFVFSARGSHEVKIVAKNIEGCSDTAFQEFLVHDLSISLHASRLPVNIGDEVELEASGSEPFTPLLWLPSSMFANHSWTTQNIRIDSSTNFTIIGKSIYGCIDTATARVLVNPIVHIPSAFSPNNDGKNDFFRAVSAGSKIRVKRMEIYNRWGQRLFVGYNGVAEKGWDGMFNEKACDLGTYFYSILVETETGLTVTEKGDITLVR